MGLVKNAGAFFVETHICVSRVQINFAKQLCIAGDAIMRLYEALPPPLLLLFFGFF